MKILHLSNHCRFGNGNVHAAVDLACAQAQLGHSVAFGSDGGFFEDLLIENGVRHFNVPQDSRRPFAILKATYLLRKLIREFKPDIIHAHMMTGAVLGYFLTRLRKPRLVTTVHNSFDGHSILMGVGDRVIAVSQAVAENMHGRGVNPKKIRTVLNGTLGGARRAGASAVPAILPRPSIATLCGLHGRKGVQDLLEAFDIVSDQHQTVNLFVIGEGPDEDKYKAQASSLRNPGRIHFLGQLRDPNPYLLSTDIFVLASHQEPFGLVITEAREAGSAIAASNVDGIPEVLKVGDAGVMFPPKNPGEMARVLLSLLNDPVTLERQKRASLSGLEYFNVSRVAKENIAVYNEVL